MESIYGCSTPPVGPTEQTDLSRFSDMKVQCNRSGIRTFSSKVNDATSSSMEECRNARVASDMMVRGRERMDKAFV